VVEIKPFDQYVVKIHGSGRLTTRNRKFLRQITPYCQSPKPSFVPMHVSQPGPTQTPATADSPEVDSPVVPERVPASDVEQGVECDAPIADTLPIAAPESDVNSSPILRKSSRSVRAPDRLQIETWKGQTYAPKPQPVLEHDKTAIQSVVYSDCLLPVRPSGGEGIHDGSYVHSLLMVPHIEQALHLH
jgi:hypothetical protein